MKQPQIPSLIPGGNDPEHRVVDRVVAYAQGKRYAVTWGRGSPGRVYRADDEIDVTVRYSSSAARWLVERSGVEVQDGGSVRATHNLPEFDDDCPNQCGLGPGSGQ